MIVREPIFMETCWESAFALSVREKGRSAQKGSGVEDYRTPSKHANRVKQAVSTTRNTDNDHETPRRTIQKLDKKKGPFLKQERTYGTWVGGVTF
jgi:hypothetical protein